MEIPRMEIRRYRIGINTFRGADFGHGPTERALGMDICLGSGLDSGLLVGSDLSMAHIKEVRVRVRVRVSVRPVHGPYQRGPLPLGLDAPQGTPHPPL